MPENSRAHLGPYPPRWKSGKDGLSYESHYRLSQQYPVILLLLLIVLAICCALIAVTFGTGRTFSNNMGFLISVFCALGVFTLLFVLVCIKSVLQKGMKLLALLIWGCLVAMGYAFIFTSNIVTPWDQVYWTLFVTVSLYTMLPLSMKVAIFAGLSCSLSHIIVLSVYVSSSSPQPAGEFALQIIADVVILLCGNVVGGYHKRVTESALKDTYHEAINFIHSRRKLYSQERQQVAQHASHMYNISMKMDKLCPKCQYFVRPPLFSSAVLTLLGMEVTSTSQAATTGILFISSMMTSYCS